MPLTVSISNRGNSQQGCGVDGPSYTLREDVHGILAEAGLGELSNYFSLTGFGGTSSDLSNLIIDQYDTTILDGDRLRTFERCLSEALIEIVCLPEIVKRHTGDILLESGENRAVWTETPRSDLKRAICTLCAFAKLALENNEGLVFIGD